MDSSQEKWVFIVNPIAGNGFAKKYSSVLQEMIKKYNIDGEMVFTERKGHATELADLYSEKGFKYIIGVGGDGTINEIARSLVHKKNVVIGVVPAGTGNDFIQILGFPNRFKEEHWRIFFERNTKAVDVGSCNGKIFLNGMGLGFDAEVASQNYVKEGEVKKGGKDKYLWHILKTLLFFKEKNIIIQSNNGKEETNCFIKTISIGRRFAGQYFITPKAIANDGLFDVCMIKKLSLIQRFKILLMVPKGTHINDKKVKYYQTEKLKIEFPEKVPFHLDGELFFASNYEISILPGLINTIYNPQGPHYFSVL
jgi:diacylglycerol kinase (ATP)